MIVLREKYHTISLKIALAMWSLVATMQNGVRMIMDMIPLQLIYYSSVTHLTVYDYTACQHKQLHTCMGSFISSMNTNGKNCAVVTIASVPAAVLVTKTILALQENQHQTSNTF